MLNSASKKKCAFLVGYLGENYFGSAINKMLKLEQTVEGNLFHSMYKCGFMHERNFEDFKKVKLDRNSRTDKGVNSISTIITAKMKIEFQEKDKYGFEIAKQMNQYLPEDIRVFSVQHIPRRRNLREDTTWREYEYLIPLESIQNQRNLDEMNEILSDFIGNNSFHCFTTSRKLNYIEDENGNRFLKDFKNSFTNYRILIKCKCEEIIEINGKEYIRISMIGLSFIQYQIRKMMGIFILILNNQVPKDYIKLALNSDYVIASPTAPPHLLTKMKCGLIKRKDGGRMFEYSNEIYEKCLEFKKNFLEPRIKIDFSDFEKKRELYFNFNYEILKERNLLFEKDQEFCSKKTRLPKGFFVYFMIQLTNVDYDLYHNSILVLKHKIENNEIESNRDSQYYFDKIKEIGFDNINTLAESLEIKTDSSDE